jgi:hypothetical protein
LFFARAGAATIGSSSYLQVNLSYMPFTYYDYNHPAASYGPFNKSCPAGSSVRSCFQTILGQLHPQGVTGVRIFITFCGASSLAFSNCGQPYSQISWNPSVDPGYSWIQNAGAFFQDVNSAGIQNVTFTTGSGYPPPLLSILTSSASSPAGSCSSSGNCCNFSGSTVDFDPLLPYGLDPGNGNFPIGDYWTDQSSNQGWNCAPINPYFLGWTNYFNVLNSVLGKAKGLVTIYELDVQQELNIQTFTTQARWIYDNSASASASPQYSQYVYSGIVDVLAAVRGLMGANGFDPMRVTYSAGETDTNSATNNCINQYDDYARNVAIGNITQAINAGAIGVATGSSQDDSPGGSLLCGGTIDSNMITLPIYSSQPGIVDIHAYPLVKGTTNTDAMIQQVAALDYGDIPHFLAEASLQSAEIVIGETYSGAIDPLNQGTSSSPNWCSLGQYESPSGAPNDNVAGFNNEGVSDPLSNYTVTFRPWMELEDPTGVCFGYGSGPGTSNNYQTVNWNGQGPYTPTNN